eukprot:5649251-Prymnesium_polylepis.1
MSGWGESHNRRTWVRRCCTRRSHIPRRRMGGRSCRPAARNVEVHQRRVERLDPAQRAVRRAAGPACADANVLGRHGHTCQRRAAEQPLLMDDLAQFVHHLHQLCGIVAELALVGVGEMKLRVAVFAHESVPRTVDLVPHKPHRERGMVRGTDLPPERLLNGAALGYSCHGRVLRCAHLERAKHDQIGLEGRIQEHGVPSGRLERVQTDRVRPHLPNKIKERRAPSEHCSASVGCAAPAAPAKTVQCRADENAHEHVRGWPSIRGGKPVLRVAHPKVPSSLDPDRRARESSRWRAA